MGHSDSSLIGTRMPEPDIPIGDHIGFCADTYHIGHHHGHSISLGILDVENFSNCQKHLSGKRLSGIRVP